MEKCFQIKSNNELHVTFEPVNDLDEFAKSCMQMLATTSDLEVYIVMDNCVDNVSSSYVGVLMSCAMLSNHMGKKLHIRCNDNLKKLINMLDGHKLMQFID
jgi:hypothetical protein